jgi:hypothetical protein
LLSAGDEEELMSARVYLLLDVLNGDSDQVAQNLRGKPGVVIAEPLEGPPDVMVVIEAPDRQRLAELAIGAIALVEGMTEGIRLLPARVTLYKRVGGEK